MRSFKVSKLFAIFVTVSILSTSSATAEDSKSEFNGKLLPPAQGQFQITFNQGADGNFGERYSAQVKPSDVFDPTRELPNYRAILPACLLPTDLTCIESIESKKVHEAVWKKGSLSTNQLDVGKVKVSESQPKWREYGTWKADPLTGKPAGGVASSWDLAATPHKEGVSYLAIVQFQASLLDNQNAFNPELGFSELNGMIQPWSWKCAESGFCDWLGSAVAKNDATSVFPPNTEFRITVRTNFLGSKIGSWMVGRLEKPTIKFDSEKLVIAGKPVSYPMGFLNFKSREECASKIESVMTKYFPRAPRTCSPPSSGFSTNSNDDVALPLFDVLDGEVTQNGEVENWTFSNGRKSNRIAVCSDPKNFSLATSNAMLYSVNPPVWDKDSSTLSYRIASTHLDRKSELNKGNYSLVISKKLADCLWNFDTAKASAEISITSSEGSRNIAVSAMRTSTDWIYFDASGFTFSAPEIKVKLINKAATTETKTITCVKGAKLKKVSGLKPKCPTGYKAKK